MIDVAQFLWFKTSEIHKEKISNSIDEFQKIQLIGAINANDGYLFSELINGKYDVKKVDYMRCIPFMHACICNNNDFMYIKCTHLKK